jgi:hypothetical protein
MDRVADNGVRNSLHSKAVGFAGVMGMLAIITVAFSWFVVANGLDAKDSNALADSVLVGAATAATAGCALYLYAIACGFHFWAALGLLGVVIAPTGFAYGGNILALIAAVLLVFVGVRERGRAAKGSQILVDATGVPVEPESTTLAQ